MPLNNSLRKIVRPLLTPVRALFNRVRGVKMFKGVKGIKSNSFLSNQKHPAISFRKGNYRSICQSSAPLNRLCIYQKPLQNPATQRQFKDERLKSGFDMPMVRYPGYVSMMRTPIAPYVGNREFYAETKEPDSPESSKGGSVKSSGGRVGRLDAANEKGFFHRVNRSRLEQIKQTMKNKDKESDKDDDEKKIEK